MIRLEHALRGSKRNSRRGVFMVFAALLMIIVFAMVAFTVDVGYMNLVKAELQNAADAAAMAGCQDLADGAAVARTTAKAAAAANLAAGSPIIITDTDIEIGVFNFSTKQFTVNETSPNAMRVTTHATDLKTFFAPVMGLRSFDSSAKSIAMLNPRDIVFVVDLSGSMNDDTEPCWATAAVNEKFGPAGYPNVGDPLIQAIYNDFGFGSYPGAYAHIGHPLGVSEDDYAIAEMTKDDGPLTSGALSTWYRIDNADDEYVRKEKAYRWIIDFQLAVLMPSAQPVPDSTINYAYWEKYLDFVIIGAWVGDVPPPPSGGGGGGGGGGGTTTPPPAPPIGWLPARDSLLDPVSLPRNLGAIASVNPLAVLELMGAGRVGYTEPGVPRRGSTEYIWVPWGQDQDQLWNFNNANIYTFPSFNRWYAYDNWRNKVGYITYVQYMMDWGRDRSPLYENSGGTDNADPSLDGRTPLSSASAYCPSITETVAGQSFSFPPRTQPMHAVRRSLISAIDVVQSRNAAIASGKGDQVGIVTFDGLDAHHSPQVARSLTADFSSAMWACSSLQATSDIGSTTATEAGLKLARDMLKPVSEGGQSRGYAKRVIVLLTDGVPNAWSSADADINSYVTGSDDASSDFYGTDYVWYNAALMQADQIFADKITLYPVGMGLGTDYDFMDRMARFARTATGGQSVRGSGNPAEYEERLIDIFEDIVKNPGSRLVK